MIKNKKLLIITILVGVLLCAAIDVPILLLGLIKVGTLASSVFFMGNAVFGLAIYTLIYHSLNKTEMLKKIYRFVVLIGVLVFLMGAILLFVNLLG